MCARPSHCSDYFAHIAECAGRATTRVIVPAGTPCPDIKLLNVRAARRRAQRRAVRSGAAADWTTYNRLDAVCRRHARQLRRRSWAGLCSSLARPRNQHRGWRVLNALLNPRTPRFPVLAIAVAQGISELALAEQLADAFAAAATAPLLGVPAVALRALYVAVFVRGGDHTHGGRIPTHHPDLIGRIESKRNIAVVSTSNEDMAARIRDNNTVHLGAKEYAVATYIAPPANSARGVAHGIPQGTTDAEFMRGLYAHKIHILQARMLGPCATALITFEGRTVPRTEEGSQTAIPISDPLQVQTQGGIATTMRQQIRSESRSRSKNRTRSGSRSKTLSHVTSKEQQPPQRASTASVVQETVEDMNTEAPPEPNPTAQPIDARVTACGIGIHENRKAIQELHMRMEKGFDEIRQMVTRLHEVFTPRVNDQRYKKPGGKVVDRSLETKRLPQLLCRDPVLVEAKMTSEEIATDYDSMLEYEGQAAGAIGLLQRQIELLASAA
ncbi:hypothetical protein HPB49_019509 [Dermacentor silvarum]|uniref:Uncharacterized protein n=1 Tax=Dermacentor silvarum TaxID=543639 RepID=A0ACB8CM88_DERSI|nr:hypothetical protein HPB49_019509 [Dermacentor silvarum]